MTGAGILPGGRHPDDPSGTRFPRPVDIEVDCGVWDLRAHPDRLDAAAKSFSEHGDQTSAAAEDIHRSCRRLLDSQQLSGESAERFDCFQSELISKLDQYEGVAERVAEQLSEAAASLRTHQETLDGIREAVLAKVPGREARPSGGPPPAMTNGPRTGGIVGCTGSPPTHIVFRASSFADLHAIEDARSEAEEVRAEADRKNAEVHGKLDEIARDLATMGRELLPGFGRSTPGNDGGRPSGPGGLTTV